jgi:hypothetical protein
MAPTLRHPRAQQSTSKFQIRWVSSLFFASGTFSALDRSHAAMVWV